MAIRPLESRKNAFFFVLRDRAFLWTFVNLTSDHFPLHVLLINAVGVICRDSVKYESAKVDAIHTASHACSRVYIRLFLDMAALST